MVLKATQKKSAPIKPAFFSRKYSKNLSKTGDAWNWIFNMKGVLRDKGTLSPLGRSIAWRGTYDTFAFLADCLSDTARFMFVHFLIWKYRFSKKTTFTLSSQLLITALDLKIWPHASVFIVQIALARRAKIWQNWTWQKTHSKLQPAQGQAHFIENLLCK